MSACSCKVVPIKFRLGTQVSGQAQKTSAFWTTAIGMTFARWIPMTHRFPSVLAFSLLATLACGATKGGFSSNANGTPGTTGNGVDSESVSNSVAGNTNHVANTSNAPAFGDGGAAQGDASIDPSHIGAPSGGAGGSGPTGGETAGIGNSAGGSGLVGVPPDDSEWEDLNCPLSITDYCANDGFYGAPCIANWSQAQDLSAWCSHGNVNAVAIGGSCDGYGRVTVFFTPDSAVPQWLRTGGTDLFFVYYYDAATGVPVRVDSLSVPSVTQCVAGVPGVRFTYGCTGEVVYCDHPIATDGGLP
jgi:hypothetical protein